MENSDKIMVAVNLLVCLCGVFVCICRMGMMTGSHTKGTVRSQYVLLLVGFVISGGSWWWFRQPANIALILLGTTILGFLLLGWGVWRHGAPLYTMRGNR